MRQLLSDLPALDALSPPLIAPALEPRTEALADAADNIISLTAPSPDLRDPSEVGMTIDLTVPSLELDLTYNLADGHHLILRMESLQTIVLTRAYDYRATFTMSELSIQDSLRHDSQKYLLHSAYISSGSDATQDREGDNRDLIQVSYPNINNTLSPYYKSHAMEVDINIAGVSMNTDVTTVLHLKPFFDVLLSKKGPPAPVAATPVTAAVNKTVDSSSSVSSAPATTSSPLSSSAVPQIKGILMNMKFNKLTLEFLRAPVYELKHQLLIPAYSWQVVDFGCRVDMLDLLKARVTLANMEVLDVRPSSEDFMFKRLFCSIEEGALQSNLLDTGLALTPLPSTTTSLNPTAAHTTDAADTNNTYILEVDYTQESKCISLVGVKVRNMTNFVVIDTILDFVDVAQCNASAYAALLAPSPTTTPPPPVIAESDFPSLEPEPELNSKDSAPLLDAYAVLKEVPATVVDTLSIQEPKPVPQLEAGVQTTVTMNIDVEVINPRLLILEDPTTLESSAIVCQSEISVHYTRETTTSTTSNASSTPLTTDVDECLHVSLKETKVLLVPNIKTWLPRRVLEPFSIEYHLKRKQRVSQVIKTSMSGDVDCLKVLISLHDIMLFQTILSQRSYLESYSKRETSTPPSTPYTPSQSVDNTTGKSDVVFTKAGVSTPSTPAAANDPVVFTLNVNMGPGVLTIVDEVLGASHVPLLRFNVNDLTYYAERTAASLTTGEGHSAMQADFYNSKLQVWEPLVEPWQMGLSLRSNAIDGTSVIISSTEELQVNISAVLLSTVLSVVASASTTPHPSSPLKTNAHRYQPQPDLLFSNTLGIPLDIYTSSTSNGPIKLLSFPDPDQSVQALALPSYVSNSMADLSSINIVFKGPFGSQRRPLVQVPLSCSKVLTYNLTCAPTSGGSGSVRSSRKGTNESMNEGLDEDLAQTWHDVDEGCYEEVEVELYENARYDPLSGVWLPPFLMGDPFQWTDASGSKYYKGGLPGVSLPSDDWEWEHDWTVDTVCEYNIDTTHDQQKDKSTLAEIDEEGWEYNTSFASFSEGTVRHRLYSTDYCRRRRWKRVRATSGRLLKDNNRPFKVYWSVKTSSSGTKQLELRSRLQVCLTTFYIHNLFPYILSYSYFLPFRSRTPCHFRCH